MFLQRESLNDFQGIAVVSSGVCLYLAGTGGLGVLRDWGRADECWIWMVPSLTSHNEWLGLNPVRLLVKYQWDRLSCIGPDYRLQLICRHEVPAIRCNYLAITPLWIYNFHPISSYLCSSRLEELQLSLSLALSLSLSLSAANKFTLGFSFWSAAQLFSCYLVELLLHSAAMLSCYSDYISFCYSELPVISDLLLYYIIYILCKSSC